MIGSYIPPEMRSDECTFPKPLKILKGVMGANRYKAYCREHDFLRRYNVVPWYKANWILGRRIATDGIVGKLRSPLYMLFTSISYPLYNKVLSLPKEWQKYANYYNN